MLREVEKEMGGKGGRLQRERDKERGRRKEGQEGEKRVVRYVERLVGVIREAKGEEGGIWGRMVEREKRRSGRR